MSNPAAYRLLGINDDTDTCDVCGKIELRRVMAIEPLDADGNSEGDAIYAGSTCGARLLTRTLGRRITGRRLVDATAAVTRVIDTAHRWAAEFAELPEARFLTANATALLNRNNGDTAAAIVDGKNLHAATVAEARKVQAARTGADLIGTRFEALLPRL